jgi:hypothetical protein
LREQLCAGAAAGTKALGRLRRASDAST